MGVRVRPPPHARQRVWTGRGPFGGAPHALGALWARRDPHPETGTRAITARSHCEPTAPRRGGLCSRGGRAGVPGTRTTRQSVPRDPPLPRMFGYHGRGRARIWHEYCKPTLRQTWLWGRTQSRNLRSRCRCSMWSAIHINSRNWLRSSSTHEPSDPPHRVVISVFFGRIRRGTTPVKGPTSFK